MIVQNLTSSALNITRANGTSTTTIASLGSLDDNWTEQEALAILRAYSNEEVLISLSAVEIDAYPDLYQAVIAHSQTVFGNELSKVINFQEVIDGGATVLISIPAGMYPIKRFTKPVEEFDNGSATTISVKITNDSGSDIFADTHGLVDLTKVGIDSSADATIVDNDTDFNLQDSYNVKAVFAFNAGDESTLTAGICKIRLQLGSFN